MKTKILFFVCLLLGIVVTPLSAEKGKKVLLTVEVDGALITKTIYMVPEATRVSVLEQGSIYVSPMLMNFGDVLIGEEKIISFTVTNIGDDTLTLSTIDLELSGDWQIVTSVWPPYFLDPDDFFPDTSSVTHEVSFSPTCEGYSTNKIYLGSNDPNNPVMEIDLIGRGITTSLDVDQIHQELETSIAGGNIEGNIDEANPDSNLAEKNLDHFRDILQKASDLYNDGLLDEACAALKNADRRSDGLTNPPDFITGDDVLLINSMIKALLDLLNCGY